MGPGFFQTIKAGLKVAAATSFGSAGLIGRMLSPNFGGLIFGYTVGAYNARERVVGLLPSDMYVPFVTLGLQSMLAELTAPFFEGDKEKAYMASAATLASIFTVLASCINPRLPQVQQPVIVHIPNRAPAKKPSGPSFSERFDKISIALKTMMEEKEDKLEPVSNSERLTVLRKFADKMEKFEKKYQNIQFELIIDPITLPESGATCDRSDLEKNIESKILTCPKTAVPLDISLIKHPATNIDVKKAIDKELKKLEAEFKKLQIKYSKAPATVNVDQQGVSPVPDPQFRPR